MRVFITGGSGYLGAHLVRALADQHALTVLTRSASRASELAPFAETTLGSLQDIAALPSWLQGQDVLVHNAIVWDDAPPGCSPELELEDTRLAIKLFEAAGRAGVRRVLMTSSLAVHRPFAGTMDEQSALHPTDSYGAIKASNEHFLSALAAAYGMAWQVVRVAPVLGAPAYEGGAFRCNARLGELIEQAKRGDDIVLTCEEQRQLVGARDVARVFAALVQSEHPSGAWICAAHCATRWASVAETVVDQLGSPSRVIETGGMMPHHFETKKLERALGFRLESEAALRETLSFLLRQT